jgi:CubicO group peptidase (beta-lactamase class C family)
MVGRLRLEGTPLSKDITVHHLLTHTSGIGDDAKEEAGERHEDLWKAKPNSIPSSKPVTFYPGSSTSRQLPSRTGMPLLQLRPYSPGSPDRID